MTPETAKAAVAYGQKHGLIQVPHSPFLNAAPVKHGPKPNAERKHIEFKCPECGRMIWTKELSGGAKIYVHHRTSEFAFNSRVCGQSGQRV